MAENIPASAGYLRDRGAGVATSLSGIYLDEGEWLGAVSYQHLENRGFQYSPEEFGIVDVNDYLGKYESSGGIIFIGYGFRESVALGLKVTGGSIKLTKASDDLSAMPVEMKESGISEIAPELTWQITFVQWSPTPYVAVRFGSRVELTQQTEGWTGELGIVVR